MGFFFPMRRDIPPVVKVGERFDRWLVIGEAANDHRGRRYLCRCDCGVERSVSGTSLNCGKSLSCGCRRSTANRKPRGIQNRRALIDPGDQFGRWTVLHEVPTEASMNRKYACRCACGTERIVRADKLRGGETRSCGCLTNAGRPVKHGHTGSPTYMAWTRVKHRAKVGNAVICDRWLDFDAFLADLGERPDGTVLRLHDTNGIFEPGNAAWVSK